MLNYSNSVIPFKLLLFLYCKHLPKFSFQPSTLRLSPGFISKYRKIHFCRNPAFRHQSKIFEWERNWDQRISFKLYLISLECLRRYFCSKMYSALWYFHVIFVMEERICNYFYGYFAKLSLGLKNQKVVTSVNKVNVCTSVFLTVFTRFSIFLNNFWLCDERGEYLNSWI